MTEHVGIADEQRGPDGLFLVRQVSKPPDDEVLPPRRGGKDGKDGHRQQQGRPSGSFNVGCRN